MKFLTIIAIFSVVVTLGNSAPTFLEWFGFDIDQATTELPDGKEPNLDDNYSATDIPFDTTQTLIDVSTESQQNTETLDTESTTDGSGSGDASTTPGLPTVQSAIGISGNNETQKAEQDDVIIENPEYQNKEYTDDNEPESQDPWKEFEDELNDELGQNDINEDDRKEVDDVNRNEEDDTQNHKKKGDEDEKAREVIKQYIRKNIETACSYYECNDQCQLQRHYGGYCKYETRCMCF